MAEFSEHIQHCITIGRSLESKYETNIRKRCIIMNLANILTTSRLILTPVCIFFIMIDGSYSKLIAFCIFVVAFLTDAFDGYLARVRKEVTEFGKFYDPLADKILTTSILISLAFRIDEIWCWLAVCIICCREIAVALMRRWRVPHGISVVPNGYGKLKTIAQAVAVGALIIGAGVAPYLLWIAVLLSVHSGINYILLWRNKQHQGMDAFFIAEK